MPDTKITALTALTAADPANDVLPIVDVSDTTMAASGTTKKISINNVLGASGTATLASATITGDLTVDTNTLFVDAANNCVGIGTITPTVYANYKTLALVGGSSGFVIDAHATGGGTAGGMQIAATPTGTNFDIFGPNAGTAAPAVIRTGTFGSVSERYRIAGDGVATWSNVGGVAGTAMTLNSTGLGVGASPLYQIYARKDQAAFTTVAIDNQNAIAAGTGTQFLLIDGGVNAGWFRRNRDGSGNTDIGYKDTLRFRGQIAGTERTDMTLDTSGNVGIGGSPSTRLHVVGGNARINDGFQLEFGGSTNSIAGSNANNTMNIYTNNVLRVSAKANGQVRFIPLASDPSGAEAGDVYYNSTSNKLKCYNGTTWNDLF